MSVLERIKHRMLFDLHQTPTEAVVPVNARDLEKLLAVVEAADAQAFQYKGMLQWMKECDDHDKLVDVYKAYRTARAELDAKDEA